MTDYIGRVLAGDGDLVHHGVKGMKWGVRNDKGHEGQQAKTSKIEKLDKKFEARSQTMATFIKVNNTAADRANREDVDRINNKSIYKGADFTKPSALRTKYYKEHQDAFVAQLEKAAGEFGTNASGTRKYSIMVTDDGHWQVTTKEVKHADEDESLTVSVEYDDLGHITKLSVPALEHSGVKGMKWGIRKDKESLNKEITAPAKVPGETSSQKYVRLTEHVKKHGANSLDDDDLRFVTQRGNAIAQINRLNERRPGWIADIAKQVLREAVKKKLNEKIADLQIKST